MHLLILTSKCKLYILCFLEQALLSTIVKRIKGFVKLRSALSALHSALPDATSEEIKAFDDECAICRVSLFVFLFAFSFFHKPSNSLDWQLQEPMAKAKKLHCNHLFHLACLRSWYDCLK